MDFFNSQSNEYNDILRVSSIIEVCSRGLMPKQRHNQIIPGLYLGDR